ncbi:hypothetical protein ML057_000454 [Klebsiella pneumoniae]|nr:hypothetical protein [Klebsiella pneumoniae]
MSDITELAQRLKAAANTTTDAIDRLKAFPGDELIDLSQHEGEQVDIDITTLNEWYELSSPANVLALVEVLEKAQETIAFQQGEIKALLSSLESRTVKLPDALLPATHKSGELFMTPDNVEQGGYLNRDDVLRVLRAAGIKVETE